MHCSRPRGERDGDKGRYPPSLDALVEEGYLRKVPIDPITKSSETWVPVYEEVDPENPPAETEEGDDAGPGIIDVHAHVGSESSGLLAQSTFGLAARLCAIRNSQAENGADGLSFGAPLRKMGQRAIADFDKGLGQLLGQ